MNLGIFERMLLAGGSVGRTREPELRENDRFIIALAALGIYGKILHDL